MCTSEARSSEAACFVAPLRYTRMGFLLESGFMEG